MNGASPPSESFLTFRRVSPISNVPTSVEPMNDSLRTIGFEISSPPIAFGLAYIKYTRRGDGELRSGAGIVEYDGLDLEPLPM